MLHAEPFFRESELGPILPAWEKLAPTPLQRPEWLLAWWRHFRSHNQELLIVAVRDTDESVVGLLPCYITRHGWTGVSVHFLGDGRACTDFQSILAVEDRKREVSECTLEWLTAVRGQLQWNVLELDGVSAGDVGMRHFAESCRNKGYEVQTVARESTWRLDLTGGWQGFMSRMTKSQRSHCRNFVNRFEKNPSLQFETAVDENEFWSALTACMELHSKRWQASGEAGCFRDPRFTGFVRDSCEQLLAKGLARVMVLKMDGSPVAVELVFLDHDQNEFVYQCGRDPELEKMRIGFTLNLLTIREACARGVEFLDYLRGDEVYKARLGSRKTACHVLRVIAPEPLAHVQDVVHVASVRAWQAVCTRFSHWRHWSTTSRI